MARIIRKCIRKENLPSPALLLKAPYVAFIYTFPSPTAITDPKHAAVVCICRCVLAHHSTCHRTRPGSLLLLFLHPHTSMPCNPTHMISSPRQTSKPALRYIHTSRFLVREVILCILSGRFHISGTRPRQGRPSAHYYYYYYYYYSNHPSPGHSLYPKSFTCSSSTPIPTRAEARGWRPSDQY